MHTNDELLPLFAQVRHLEGRARYLTLHAKLRRLQRTTINATTGLRVGELLRVWAGCAQGMAIRGDHGHFAGCAGGDGSTPNPEFHQRDVLKIGGMKGEAALHYHVHNEPALRAKMGDTKYEATLAKHEATAEKGATKLNANTQEARDQRAELVALRSRIADRLTALDPHSKEAQIRTAEIDILTRHLQRADAAAKASGAAKSASGGKTASADPLRGERSGEDIHATAARRQSEQKLATEVKPTKDISGFLQSNVVPITGPGEVGISGPNAGIDVAKLLKLYGPAQLGAALSGYLTKNLREGAAQAHIDIKGLKTNAAIVSKMTYEATGHNYSANFGIGNRAGSSKSSSAGEGKSKSAGADKTPGSSKAKSTPMFTSSLVPITGPDEVHIGPNDQLNAYKQVQLYGHDQLRQSLDGYMLSSLKAAAAEVERQNPGTRPTSRANKQALIDYMMIHTKDWAGPNGDGRGADGTMKSAPGDTYNTGGWRNGGRVIAPDAALLRLRVQLHRMQQEEMHVPELVRYACASPIFGYHHYFAGCADGGSGNKSIIKSYIAHKDPNTGHEKFMGGMKHEIELREHQQQRPNTADKATARAYSKQEDQLTKAANKGAKSLSLSDLVDLSRHHTNLQTEIDRLASLAAKQEKSGSRTTAKTRDMLTRRVAEKQLIDKQLQRYQQQQPRISTQQAQHVQQTLDGAIAKLQSQVGAAKGAASGGGPKGRGGSVKSTAQGRLTKGMSDSLQQEIAALQAKVAAAKQK